MAYDPELRQGEPGEDDSLLSAIEIRFHIPTWVEPGTLRAIQETVERICRAPKNTPVGGVHWAAGCGSKPGWSQADQRMLGKPVDPSAPATGEPTFDDSVFQIETCSREK
jgi:hypothetical protein